VIGFLFKARKNDESVGKNEVKREFVKKAHVSAEV